MAILVFDSASAALKVRKKLDQHILHGKMLSLRPVVNEDRIQIGHADVSGQAMADNESNTQGSGPVTRRSQLGNINVESLKGQAKRTGRVIVRNLSFKATEIDLKVF